MRSQRTPESSKSQGSYGFHVGKYPSPTDPMGFPVHFNVLISTIIQVGGLGFIGAALSISASRVVQSFFYWLCLGGIVVVVVVVVVVVPIFKWIISTKFWDLDDFKFQREPAKWTCWEMPNYVIMG